MSDWIQEDYYFDIELDLEAQEQLNDNIRAEYEVIDYKARCPVCGAELVHESGCVTCYSCGWSACE